MKLDNLTVGDLMTTAVLTVQAGDTLGRADADMAVAGIRHLPVIDGRNRVVGILSDRDILRGLGQGRNLSVSRIMTPQVHTVHPRSPARDAVEKMILHKIGSLPVVGDEMELVGIISETDFLEVALQALGGRSRV